MNRPVSQAGAVVLRAMICQKEGSLPAVVPAQHHAERADDDN